MLPICHAQKALFIAPFYVFSMPYAITPLLLIAMPFSLPSSARLFISSALSPSSPAVTMMHRRAIFAKIYDAATTLSCALPFVFLFTPSLILSLCCVSAARDVIFTITSFCRAPPNMPPRHAGRITPPRCRRLKSDIDTVSAGHERRLPPASRRRRRHARRRRDSDTVLLPLQQMRLRHTSSWLAIATPLRHHRRHVTLPSSARQRRARWLPPPVRHDSTFIVSPMPLSREKPPPPY